jgi:hypothetical protein
MIGGATVPGAMVFNNLANGNGSHGLAPRIGFVYQIRENSVIRGGFAEYYGATISGSWAGNPYPTDGFSTNPTVSNVTGGVTQAYYFGNGFPNSAITFPPNISPAVENGASPVGVLPDQYEMPRWLNYTFSFQHQWHGNMDLTVAYVGNHGTRLPINAYNLGPEANENAGSVLQYGSLLTAGAFNNGVPTAQLVAAGFTTPPYPGCTGDLAQALRPFPQHQFDGGTQFPNRVSGQSPLAGGGFKDPNSQVYYNANAFSLPSSGFGFGNMPRTISDIRGFHYYNEDLSLYKDTYFGESNYVRVQATAGNLFNRVDFCSPNSTVGSPSFGVTSTQCNIPRRIQVGLQIFF